MAGAGKSKLLFFFVLLIAGIIYPQNFEGIKKINGNDIFIKTAGSGEPVVIVHGGPGLAHNYLFTPFVSNLSSSYRLIFYDQYGCGKSASFKAGDTVSIDRYVDELEGIRKEFNLDKMNLAGQSFGARIAIGYVLKYPARVKKLLLLEPSYGSSEYLKDFQETINKRLSQNIKNEIIALAGTEEFKQAKGEAVKKLLYLRHGAYFYDTSLASPRQYGYFNDETGAKFMLTQQKFTPLQLNFNIYPELPKINTPVLIVRGEYDPINLESIKRMAGAIKDCRLIIIKNCGHYAHIEKPEEYFGCINKFLVEK